MGIKNFDLADHSDHRRYRQATCNKHLRFLEPNRVKSGVSKDILNLLSKR